jgi:hypothetical protein
MATTTSSPQSQQLRNLLIETARIQLAAMTSVRRKAFYLSPQLATKTRMSLDVSVSEVFNESVFQASQLTHAERSVVVSTFEAKAAEALVPGAAGTLGPNL